MHQKFPRAVIILTITLFTIIECKSILNSFSIFEANSSNPKDLNEEWKRKEDREKLKQSYHIQTNKHHQYEKECNEITKKYIKNEYNYIINNCEQE